MFSVSSTAGTKVLKNHQQLLLCVGLSVAIEDAQQRSKAVGSNDIRSFSEESHKLATPILLSGIKNAIDKVREYSEPEDLVRDKGFTVMDVFYSKVNKFIIVSHNI